MSEYTVSVGSFVPRLLPHHGQKFKILRTTKSKMNAVSRVYENLDEIGRPDFENFGRIKKRINRRKT